jgi:2-polyprenyl-6-methoxyphenol hydroxylase-like FAD-dependent oxidoreductase
MLATPGNADGNADRDDTIDADFIVDASGRGSRTPEWLNEMGYPAPAETVINPFLRYASRLYAPPPDFAASWKSLLMRGVGPLVHRGGIIFQIEGGRWLVTLAGANRDFPPLDHDGFLEFARSLGDPPELYEALRHAEPLTDPAGYQRTENRWRHYEAMPRWPDHFVVLGDAVCAFNPVYGQGMTAAAMQAEALDDALRQAHLRWQGVDGLAWQVQRSVGKLLHAPWLMATSEDFRGAATEGPRPSRAIKAVHAYLDKVAVCAASHPVVYRTYLEVTQLTKPPTALFHPSIAMRVLATRGPRAIPASRS